MIAPKLIADSQVSAILELLRAEFGKTHPDANIEAYRFDRESIRIRIIDPGLSKILLTRRTKPIWNLLRKSLPKSIRRQIDFLILLTPTEAKRSAMSHEFDDPVSQE